MEGRPSQPATTRRDSTEADSGQGRLAILVVDAERNIVFAEGAAIDVLAKHPALLAAIEAAIGGRRSSIAVVAAGRTFDITVEPRHGGGAIVGATGRNDQAERDRDRELSLVFSQAPGAVWWTDRSLVLTRAYGRFSEELRLDATTGMQASLFDVFGRRAPEDPLIAAHLVALEGHPRSYRQTHRGRTFDVITEPLRDESRHVVGTVSAAVDVTELVDVEQRLARTQALLAEAQHAAHVGCWEWDVASDRLTWTDEMYRIYGISHEELDGTLESVMNRIAPEDVQQARDVMSGALEKGLPFSYDHRIVHADGGTRMLHVRGAVIADTRGKPTRLVGTCWDITDRWTTSRALDRTASLLRATLEATADGILVVGRNRRSEVNNLRLLDLWRVPPKLVETGTLQELLAYVVDQLEDPAGFANQLEDAHAHPERETFSVIRFTDGRVYECVSRPQRLGDEVVGRVWSFRDISERERLLRRAEFLADAARLLSSLDIERALSSVVHLAVPFLGDGCAIDLLAEGAPRRLHAVSRERTPAPPELSPIVLSGRSLVYAVGVTAQMAVPLIVNGAVVGAITFAAAPNRRYSPTDVALAQELAGRTALALEKSQLLQRAQQALRAREEFLAVAAHEIRGPVTSMHLAVQALLRHKLPEPATTRALELIEREDRRLGRFVEELLDLGLTQADAVPLEIEQVSLARTVRDVVSERQDDISRSGCPLSLELDEQAIGMWNRERLGKVVATLLSNALKFGLGKPVEVRVAKHDGHATLTVQDHGMGIAADAQQRIFKPFERAVSTRHYGGLGLGLYIASSIVRGLAGTISVSSQLGAGSSFTVELPQGATHDRVDDSLGR
ncbi:MAG: ATP-binding protein [Polyangiales bacterium]